MTRYHSSNVRYANICALYEQGSVLSGIRTPSPGLLGPPRRWRENFGAVMREEASQEPTVQEQIATLVRYIGVVYNVVLNRDPDTAEIQQHANELLRGRSPIVDSPVQRVPLEIFD